MATNYEMISELAEMMEFDFDGDNLKTFSEWRKAGYSVKKGETAFMKLDLWKPFTKKLTDENNKPIIDPETGKQEEESRFMLKASHLFTASQVQEGIKEFKPKAKKAPAKKRTYKKKQTA